MGWSFACDTYFKRADQIAKFRGDKFFSEGYKLVDSRVVGNHFWGLVETVATGEKTIWLGLMQGGGRTMGWGYKSMDEQSGPYYYDCPLSLLDKASQLEDTDRNRHAIPWRAKVREYHAKKKLSKKPVSGMVVSIGERKYKLLSPYAPRRGWAVVDVDSGMNYRMPAKQLSRALMA